MKIILVIIICLYWIKIGIYCIFFYSIKRNICFLNGEKKIDIFINLGKINIIERS